jgi:hypothetical protein
LRRAGRRYSSGDLPVRTTSLFLGGPLTPESRHRRHPERATQWKAYLVSGSVGPRGLKIVDKKGMGVAVFEPWPVPAPNVDGARGKPSRECSTMSIVRPRVGALGFRFLLGMQAAERHVQHLQNARCFARKLGPNALRPTTLAKSDYWHPKPATRRCRRKLLAFSHFPPNPSSKKPYAHCHQHHLDEQSRPTRDHSMQPENPMEHDIVNNAQSADCH